MPPPNLNCSNLCCLYKLEQFTCERGLFLYKEIPPAMRVDIYLTHFISAFWFLLSFCAPDFVLIWDSFFAFVFCVNFPGAGAPNPILPAPDLSAHFYCPTFSYKYISWQFFSALYFNSYQSPDFHSPFSNVPTNRLYIPSNCGFPLPLYSIPSPFFLPFL